MGFSRRFFAPLADQIGIVLAQFQLLAGLFQLGLFLRCQDPIFHGACHQASVFRFAFMQAIDRATGRSLRLYQQLLFLTRQGLDLRLAH